MHPTRTLTFHSMTEADWPAVRRIYAEGIATGMATFESAPPAAWTDFIKSKIADCCLVARDAAGTLAAWAVLIPVSSRPVYRGVAEMSLYVSALHRGQRIGDALMAEMIRHSEAQGFWTLQSATFPQNAASLALQQRHGFRLVGIRAKIGRLSHGPLAGQWCDTLLLERRSRLVGQD
ncbi:MAG: N-acetyltransferase [Opitutus sp.]|nr:N-acetyltransferase [Opitutus sp.]